MNRRNTVLVGAGAALLLFVTMALTIRATEAWAGEGSTDAQARANDLDNLVRILFDGQVIGFEVLGVLLTAAMIGAMVIARPMEAIADEDRYAHVTDQELAAAQTISDVKDSDLAGNPAALKEDVQ